MVKLSHLSYNLNIFVRLCICQNLLTFMYSFSFKNFVFEIFLTFSMSGSRLLTTIGKPYSKVAAQQILKENDLYIFKNINERYLHYYF